MANAFPSRGSKNCRFIFSAPKNKARNAIFRRCVAARNNLVAPLGTLSGPCHLRKRVAGGRGLWYTEFIWAAPAALCKVSRGPLRSGPHPDRPNVGCVGCKKTAKEFSHEVLQTLHHA